MTLSDEIFGLFQRRGASAYGEGISTTLHSLQTAHFAAQAGAPPALVLAGLLHDIGHLVSDAPEHIEDWHSDLKHEEVGANWLARHLPASVYEPVRLHVRAKRYLSAIDPKYRGELSEASIRTLELQGGPMTRREAEAFEAEPRQREAVLLRRADDRGKIVGLAVPPLESYRGLIESLGRPSPAGPTERVAADATGAEAGARRGRLRRTDKAMSDEEVAAFLGNGFCGRTATIGADGYPYVVPNLFVFREGEVYLHTAQHGGHFLANVRHDARVSFEVDEPGDVFPYGNIECDTSVSYTSVILFGRIRIVADEAEKIAFYTSFMAKYAPPDSWGRERGSFPRLAQTVVYAITPDKMTGKRGVLPPLDERWPARNKTLSPGYKSTAAAGPAGDTQAGAAPVGDTQAGAAPAGGGSVTGSPLPAAGSD